MRLVYNERGHQRLQVIEFDLNGGHRVLVDERSETFIDYAGKYYLRFLDQSQELIWMSERDGWNHLYLIDQASGAVKRQLTRGNWVVREVVEVNETKRTHAHRIHGKLMLSVGELDTNVDPASTLQLVDALIRADKDFELLFFPGAGHGVGSGQYGSRRRIDFLSALLLASHFIRRSRS